MKTWFVYILRCGDGTLYTGITTDIDRRLNEHNSGKTPGARYTRSRLPVVLVYTENCNSRAQASKREAAIKRLTRKSKRVLCESWDSSSLRCD